MAKAKVKLNSRGVVDLLTDDGLTAHIASEVGEPIAARMAASAPHDSGRLAGSHRVWTERHSDRNVIRVGSDVSYAAEVAIRTGYMARALDG